MADESFYGFRVVTNPAIPEGVIYTRTGVIETLAQEVERLRTENAALRPVVEWCLADKEYRKTNPNGSYEEWHRFWEECAFGCGAIESEPHDGEVEVSEGKIVTRHAPDCIIVLAARVMGSPAQNPDV